MTASALTAHSEAPMGTMNTTPLIDVMLVLLIMFIITLPIQTHAVSVDLPTDGPEIASNPIQNRLTINRAGGAAWNGQPVNQVQLASLVQTARAMQPQPALLFEPDANAPYVAVDQVIALIRRTGSETLGFVGNERYRDDF